MVGTLKCAECGGNHRTEICETHARLVSRPPVMTPAPQVPLGVGDRLGNYWLTRLLGKGTSSEVFLGENDVTQAVAAIKVLRPEMHYDKEMVRRFESEARTTNLVRHEHVVEIFDIGRHADWQHYIQLEHLNGPTLTWLLEKGLDPGRSARIVLQLCSALGAAHAKGVVHRDLKPANVFVLERNGLPHVKLVDFGMARRDKLEEGEDRTQVGTILGTASYMSPEQAQGLEADGRSDIYSLGVLMFRMATGRLPFEGENAMSVIVAHAHNPPPVPRSLNPEISPAYEAVILQCLAKSPADRLQSMAAVGRAVAAAVGSGLVPSAPRTGGPATQTQYVPSQTPVPLGGDTPVPAVPRPLGSPRPDVERDPAMLPTPAAGKPSVRREARVYTSFGVQVYCEPHGLMGDAVIGDISMGGAFVRSSLSLPLFSRIRLLGTSSAGPMDISGELVRVVISEQANRGFGVRFDGLSAEQRWLLTELTRPRVSEDGTFSDPHAEAELLIFESRLNGDGYAMIGVPKDASTRRIRDVCERLNEEMLPRHFPRLSASQAQRLETVTQRLMEVEELLIDPERRALNDAVNGNVLGVLRCITEGLPLERLEDLRAEFMKVRPDADELARPALMAAASAEQKGDLVSALGSIADALCHDPLNLALHRKAADLRGRSKKVKTEPWMPAFR